MNSTPNQLRPRDGNTGPVVSGLPTSAALEIGEPGTRLYLLTRLISTIEQTNEQQLAHLLGCGFTPDLVQDLRGMTLADAVRFTAGHCGLSITVDTQALRTRLASVERARADRQLYEYFIHHGASPRLVASLFRVSPNEVRRMRKLLAPAMACGGRPRALHDALRRAVAQAWERICRQEPSERQRFWLLHQEFSSQQIASLEAIIRPDAQTGAAGYPGSTRANARSVVAGAAA